MIDKDHPLIESLPPQEHDEDPLGCVDGSCSATPRLVSRLSLGHDCGTRATAEAHPGGIVDLSIGTPVDATPERAMLALSRAANSPGTR